MAYANGTPVNGLSNGYAENGASKQHNGHETFDASNKDSINDIPPAGAYANPEHMENITIPLNDVHAFTPTKKLRVVTIGAGYAGMTLAQKLQHKYAGEMEKMVDHTIFESKESVGGTWIANTYPGVMCDVPAMIYVGRLGVQDPRGG